VGTILALTADAPHGPLRVSNAMLGLGVSLVGAGLVITPTASVRLSRHCAGDAVFEARRRLRIRRTGLSFLGAGAAGVFASLILLATNPAVDDYGDYSPGPYVILGTTLGIFLVGAVVTGWSRRLERAQLDVAIGPASLHLRGRF